MIGRLEERLARQRLDRHEERRQRDQPGEQPQHDGREVQGAVDVGFVVRLGEPEEHGCTTAEARDVGAEALEVGDVGEIDEQDVVAREVGSVALGECRGESEERFQLSGDRREGHRVGDDPDDVERHLGLVGEGELVDCSHGAGTRDPSGEAGEEGHDLTVERRTPDELERHLVAHAEVQRARRLVVEHRLVDPVGVEPAALQDLPPVEGRAERTAGHREGLEVDLAELTAVGRVTEEEQEVGPPGALDLRERRDLVEVEILGEEVPALGDGGVARRRRRRGSVGTRCRCGAPRRRPRWRRRRRSRSATRARPSRAVAVEGRLGRVPRPPRIERF